MTRLVWVVDDCEDLAENLVEILRLEGYRAVGKGSWQQLDESLRYGLPDLILLDLLMPGKGGLDILSELQVPAYRGVPVVVFTGHGDPKTLREKALAAGAVAFLSKPVGADELLAVVQRYARRP
jgi:DNA-binding NtrC family response regulator